MHKTSNESHHEELLLTVSEASEKLHVSPRTIYRMLGSGELRRVKVRGCTRIRGGDLAEYVSDSGGFASVPSRGRPRIEGVLPDRETGQIEGAGR